jgi:hypothetical protein
MIWHDRQQAIRFLRRRKLVSEAAYNKGFPVSWEQMHRDARALAWRLLEKGPYLIFV